MCRSPSARRPRRTRPTVNSQRPTMNVEPIRWRGRCAGTSRSAAVAARGALGRAAATRTRSRPPSATWSCAARRPSASRAAFGIALAAQRGDDVDAAAAELRSVAADRGQSDVGGRPDAARARAGRDLTRRGAAIFDEDVEANKPHRPLRRRSSSARHATVLTHCNAGALATAGYGTALGVIRAAVESGQAHRRLRRRNASVSAGRAAHRVGAAAGRHRRHAHHRQHGRALLPAGTLRRRHRRRRPHRRERRHGEQDRHVHCGRAGQRARRAVLRRRAAVDDRSRTPERRGHSDRGAQRGGGDVDRRRVDRAGGHQRAPSGVRRHAGAADHGHHHRPRRAAGAVR